jgi:hypothetical protein
MGCNLDASVVNRHLIEKTLGVTLPKNTGNLHIEIRQADPADKEFDAYVKLQLSEIDYQSLVRNLGLEHASSGYTHDHGFSFGSSFWEMMRIQGKPVPDWWDPDTQGALPNTTYAKRSYKTLVVSKYERGSAYVVFNSNRFTP